MHTKPYEQEIDVELTEEEIRLRFGQAARAWSALDRQDTRIETTKATHKREIDQLKEDRTTIISTARTAGREAETGKAPRKMMLEDVIVGRFVISRRVDTQETIEEREADESELAAWDAIHNPAPARVPGSKTTEAEPTKPGATIEERDAKRARTLKLAMLDEKKGKPAAEKWILNKLLMNCPEAALEETKAWLAHQIASGVLFQKEERTDKLSYAAPAAPPLDDDPGYVPDDYQPTDVQH